jgi:hypothetical protein
MKKKLILHKDRPMRHISLRVPEDVLENLKRVAPLKGMSGYQALMKFYVGQGLRKDLRELWQLDNAAKLEAVLVECGVEPEQRQEIMERLKQGMVEIR